MADNRPFRFMDLPVEIRNQIYQKALCTFKRGRTFRNHDELARILAQQPEPNGVNLLSHEIETAILRTCKLIHQEAYDVMVKTNRFIRVTTYHIALSRHLISKQVPIVNLDRQAVGQFEGYLLHFTIRPAYLEDDEALQDGPFFDIMILNDDWAAFCQCFIHDDNREVSLKIHIDPCSLTRGSRFKPALTEAFIEKILDGLLEPIQDNFNGFKTAEMEGPVPDDITKNVIQSVTSTSPWVKNGGKLRFLDMSCRTAKQLQDDGDCIAASALWSELSSFLYDTTLYYSNEAASASMRGIYLTMAFHDFYCYTKYAADSEQCAKLDVYYHKHLFKGAQQAFFMVSHLEHTELGPVDTSIWTSTPEDKVRVDLLYCKTIVCLAERLPDCKNLFDDYTKRALKRAVENLPGNDEALETEVKETVNMVSRVITNRPLVQDWRQELEWICQFHSTELYFMSM